MKVVALLLVFQIGWTVYCLRTVPHPRVGIEFLEYQGTARGEE